MSALAFSDLGAITRARPPSLAVVLGSGLYGVAQRLTDKVSVPFEHVPGLCATTVAGHEGRLTHGIWAGKSVLLFEGRLHYYEGHSWSRVVRPIEIAHELGARRLLVTNAAGGIHDALGPGSLLVLRQHIDWTSSPLAQRADQHSPSEWATLPSLYCAQLIELLLEAGRRSGHDLPTGVYAQVTGPCYETPAEVRLLRLWGADAVGMSTVPEIQRGHELGLACAGLSGVTNRAAGLGGLGAGPLSHNEVLAAAAQLGRDAGDVIEEFLRLLD